MAVSFTTKGYIEVWRDGQFISRHTVETNAVESALAHALANEDGEYELRFPNKIMASKLKRRIPAILSGTGAASCVASVAATGVEITPTLAWTIPDTPYAVPGSWYSQTAGQSYNVSQHVAGLADVGVYSITSQAKNAVAGDYGFTIDQDTGVISVPATLENPASTDSYSVAVTLSDGTTSAGSRTFSFAVQASSGTYVATHYVAPVSPPAGTPAGAGAADDEAQTAPESVYLAATNPATPCTLGTAMRWARAGHNVRCAPGVYYATAVNGDRFAPAWRPAFSGTSHTSPIVFYAEYPAAYNRANPERWTELRRRIDTWWAPGTSGGDINAVTGPGYGDGAARNYVYWDGFYINERLSRSGPSNGCVSIRGNAVGIRIRRFLIDRRDMSNYGTWCGVGPTYSGYNGNSIFAQWCTDVRIQDCYFWGNSFEAMSVNDGCHESYDSNDFTIENCTFVNAGGGPHFKAGTNRASVGQYNFIEYNIGDGHGLVSQLSQSVTWHHNLVKGANQCMTWFTPAGGIVSPVRAYNNTIIVSGTAGGGGQNGWYHRINRVSNGTDAFYNNIVVVNTPAYGPSNLISYDTPGVLPSAFNRLNHNVYYRFDGAGSPRWVIGASTSSNITQYKAVMASYGTDPHGDVYESDSIYADPLFADYSTGDYSLQAGSPARTAGVSGAIAGCYDGTGEVGIRANPTY